MAIKYYNPSLLYSRRRLRKLKRCLGNFEMIFTLGTISSMFADLEVVIEFGVVNDAE